MLHFAPAPQVRLIALPSRAQVMLNLVCRIIPLGLSSPAHAEQLTAFATSLQVRLSLSNLVGELLHLLSSSLFFSSEIRKPSLPSSPKPLTKPASDLLRIAFCYSKTPAFRAQGSTLYVLPDSRSAHVYPEDSQRSASRSYGTNSFCRSQSYCKNSIWAA